MPGPAMADTLEWALVQAYQNNPQLNSQRASCAQTDEGVPQALSGYRPRVSATANVGVQSTQTTLIKSGSTYRGRTASAPSRRTASA